MTAPAQTPPCEFADVDGAIAILRAHGLRISTARRVMLDLLFASDAPATAEAIAGRLTSAGIPADLASVYRNLEALERAGIVRHVHLGHGPGLYALAGGREREYLHCECCGAVQAVAPAELDAARDAIRAAFGFEARFTHFPIVGRCGGCSGVGVAE